MRSKSGLISLATLIGVLFAAQTFAHDVEILWTNATHYTDGSPIEAAGPNAIERTDVRYGTCGAADVVVTVQAIISAAWPQTSAAALGLSDGTYCFQARHITVGNKASVWSSGVRKVLATPITLKKPREPNGVVVNPIVVIS